MMDFWSSKRGKMLEITVLVFITIFGVGSQFFSNLAYSLNQGILQTSFGIDSQYLIIPSVLANFTFALGNRWGIHSHINMDSSVITYALCLYFSLVQS